MPMIIPIAKFSSEDKEYRTPVLVAVSNCIQGSIVRVRKK
jgi:hypothetical protein